MREILFRGKRIDNGEWEFGKLKSIHKGGANYETAYYILDCYGETRNGLARDAVIPETIGQFTGLLDKNGKKIFEGDIVHDLVFKATVEYCDNLAGYFPFATEIKSIYSDECEVIGNKFDNKVGE